jgi:23S rRNA-/tRNA-specific pseudouridylate synthase
MDLRILFQNENYIGFFKIPKIPTTFGVSSEFFLKYVKENFPQLFKFAGYKENEGGLLYRLDNDTCGLLLFAKTKEAFDKFVNAKNLFKLYIAKISNIPLQKNGIIDFPIVHKSSKKMATLLAGKKVNFNSKANFVKTYYSFKNPCFMQCKIDKGIRHQIRVHLASIGCPIVGDSLYKGKESESLHLACYGISSDFLNINILENLEKFVNWL